MANKFPSISMEKALSLISISEDYNGKIYFIEYNRKDSLMESKMKYTDFEASNVMPVEEFVKKYDMKKTQVIEIRPHIRLYEYHYLVLVIKPYLKKES